MCVLSRVQLFVTLWTVALQAPLSMGFPMDKNLNSLTAQATILEWVDISFSRGLLDPRIKPESLAAPAKGRQPTIAPPGKSKNNIM